MVVCYPMLATDLDLVPGLNSQAAAMLLGVTYRQLDFAIRTVPALRDLPLMSKGSGSRRRFDTDTLRRLDVAARLNEANPGDTGGGGRSSFWLPAVEAAMDGPVPPEKGFAVLTPGRPPAVMYRATLRAADFPVGPVGGVVRYDLTRTALGVYLAEYASAA
jgi:hypothetical protein